MGPKRIHTDYAVGTSQFSCVDESRNETLGFAEGKRKIAVRLYYPVSHETIAGCEKEQYLRGRKAEALRKAYHIPKKAIEKDSEVEYYANLPMMEGEKFPLILFSHGYNAYIESNTYLCIELASAGYIVASVGHAYEAIANEYEDGSYDQFDKTIGKKMYKKGFFSALKAQKKIEKMQGSLEEAYEKFLAFQNEHTPFIAERVPEWRKDMQYALSEIKKRYSDYIDFTNGVGATGHSLGGATAYNLCINDDEISCGINIDGAIFGDYAGKELRKPFYQISCKENWNLESSVLLHRKAPVHTAIFEQMKHIGFTDAKFFASSKMLVGTLDAQDLHIQLTQCHVAFFDRYLKGKETKLDELAHPAVAISTFM